MLPSVNGGEITDYRNQCSPSTICIPGIKLNCVRSESKFLYLLNHFISSYVKEKEIISFCILHFFLLTFPLIRICLLLNFRRSTFSLKIGFITMLMRHFAIAPQKGWLFCPMHTLVVYVNYIIGTV